MVAVERLIMRMERYASIVKTAGTKREEKKRKKSLCGKFKTRLSLVRVFG